MVRRQFYNKHNMVVSFDLEAQGVAPYREILEFLVRSRVYYALTHSSQVMITYIRQFWATAHHDCSVDPPVIRARVHDQDIAFSASDLRTILALGTEDQENGPIEFPFAMRSGAFQRMGYTGDLTRASYIKSNLFGQWRYLMHVLNVSLIPRKAGFDVMTAKQQSILISLVYNKPFSFSRYFFTEFIHQINAPAHLQFLLYPRFVMMIIRHALPNIPPQAEVVQVSTVGRRIYVDCLSHSVRKAAEPRPQPTPLFGHLINTGYVAPADDGWLDAVEQDPNADVVVEEAHPTRAPEIPQATEQQDVLGDVFDHLEKQSGHGVDPEVDAEVVQEMVQGRLVAEDVFAEIENYAPEQPHGRQREESSCDKTDSDATDDDDSSRLVVVDSSSKGKRKIIDDNEEFQIEEPGLIPRQARRQRVSLFVQDNQGSSSQAATILAPVTTTTPSTTTIVPTTNKVARAVATTTREAATTSNAATTPVSPPIPSSESVPLSDVAKIASLQAQVLSLVNQLVVMSGLVKTLTDRNQGLDLIVAKQQKQLDRHERLIAHLMKNQPAQGETTSYNADDLRAKRDEDKDDDPNTPRDSELPGSSSKPGMPAIVQVESSQTHGVGSEKAPPRLWNRLMRYWE